MKIASSSIGSIGGKDSLVVIGSDGSFYRYDFTDSYWVRLINFPVKLEKETNNVLPFVLGALLGGSVTYGYILAMKITGVL